MIVKSSELTRTGREGGRRVRDEGGGLPWVVFFFGNEVKISGSRGEKSAKIKPGKRAKKTKAERLLMARAKRTGRRARRNERASLAPSALSLALSLCHWVGSSRAADSDL